MGRKRKSDEVDVTPSPMRVTRASAKHGTGVVSRKPQDDTEPTRLVAYASSASSDDEEVFNKGKKKTKATNETETSRKSVSKGKDSMFEGSPSSKRYEKLLRNRSSYQGKAPVVWIGPLHLPQHQPQQHSFELLE